MARTIFLVCIGMCDFLYLPILIQIHFFENILWFTVGLAVVNAYPVDDVEVYRVSFPFRF